ncbi:hypothetical protein STPH2_1500 [Streptomyces sp. KO7888]|nr:hypothetical protein [Streptomyces sp. KO7888]
MPESHRLPVSRRGDDQVILRSPEPTAKGRPNPACSAVRRSSTALCTNHAKVARVTRSPRTSTHSLRSRAHSSSTVSVACRVRRPCPGPAAGRLGAAVPRPAVRNRRLARGVAAHRPVAAATSRRDPAVAPSGGAARWDDVRRQGDGGRGSRCESGAVPPL